MGTNVIYIVEDEEKIANILFDYLNKDGFEPHIILDGTHAAERIIQDKPNLVILDLMLSGKSGFDICSEVRQVSNVPIIMLTARIDEKDRILGLNIGADDYVCKPFLPGEVVARVEAILRRVNGVKHEEVSSKRFLSYQNVTLDTESLSCLVDGSKVDLTPIEFRLLQVMMQRPKRVYSRDSLMDICYLDDRIINDRTIDSHMRNLRKKIKNFSSLDDDLIHTVYGVGYKVE
ncbi:response regulator [Marinomonas posidonica]|uniref:Two component transcriptional regulator, winged helix family n=1 Tax=Marinomonas posidonica (strain CECT 7376 / NCIMB 14433 / IVIA-Po-181) TaxID=491952 RepID=F6D103_MARPP|nr:response regulator [Marinomonas posidonica]AEF53726.1 two component transcriptional regulator, winged helix family [Marinomonas posidonica IVIA-Po-181]